MACATLSLDRGMLGGGKRPNGQNAPTAAGDLEQSRCLLALTHTSHVNQLPEVVLLWFLVDV
ncbi:hypothetical protein LX32DRAFT_644979 [Colletotrichum zoysiae]|uniref:Uncharacterized protein n=1 Tax=Colletotrichum zoysiae TaxID=1216348 RepID=A0AAD9LYT4_9PEZI|nr:hypothetical protein LX32DRAFT_644979 [Colletotrichum zoysiae]